VESETIEFETSDNVALTGDLAEPALVRATAIVCHPHPQFGGDRFNPVVDALVCALVEVGVAALRFDFRTEFDGGRGERLDAEAALRELRGRFPDVASLATGYSFGAMVVLSLDDDALFGKVLVAPPLGRSSDDVTCGTPTLVLTPAHDQFASPDVTEPVVRTWANAELEVVESADHFLVGRAAAAAERGAAWVDRRLSRADH